jgi:hypothetical protein
MSEDTAVRSNRVALLAYVHSLIPIGAAVFLVGDCEFGSVAVLRQLDRWRWFYVLRQKSDTGVWISESNDWQAFGSCIHKPGQSLWLGSGYLTAQRDLSDQSAGSLEGRRKRALVPGHQFA